ncbi:MAG: hypothetical protein ABI707_03670 [Ferruginibacter sp.]
MIHYDQLLNNVPVIPIGDFNSNKKWDKIHRVGNHTHVVELLAGKNIISAYHQHSGEEQGDETTPTFYLQRNKNKPYHIDYCFISADMYEKFQTIEIGSYENWIAHSDNSPITIKFDQ